MRYRLEAWGVRLRPDGNVKLAEIDSTGAWIRKATSKKLFLIHAAP